jgi:hypothetical protein
MTVSIRFCDELRDCRYSRQVFFLKNSQLEKPSNTVGVEQQLLIPDHWLCAP